MKIGNYICCLIIIMIGIINTGNSQNMSKTPTIGIKGGVLLSTITGDEAIDEFAKKLGAQIGVTGAYYFIPKLSVGVN